ncbi:kinase-like protein [Hypoxylon sp. EC38]|nr:kinase-like protein [Hypoxylon sp. EC38]
MDIVSLVASSIGVADIVTRLGFGLRHLQQEFSGALDHVENIAQQTGAIDFAIREICSFVNKSPNKFLPSFASRLEESMAAIDEVVGQIQHHVQSVKTEAERSPSKGKMLHLRRADKVIQWESNLGVQIQALSLLLQVAQLCVSAARALFFVLILGRRSNDEMTSVLEQDSSKKLFEKASSMSAKIGNSSCIPSSGKPCLIDIKSFSFDPILLQTKVYRRACESSWRQAVTLNKEDIAASTSSTNAIASQSGDLDADTSYYTKGDYEKGHSSLEPERNIGLEVRKTEHRGISTCPPQLLSEASTADTTKVTIDSSGACATGSTLATTISLIAQSKDVSEPMPKSDSSLRKSLILVFVEKVGSDHVEFPIGQVSDHYNYVSDSILEVRDRVLLTGGIDPRSYQGSLVNCTIEACGNEDHKFPFTSTFLGAALEKMEEGFYISIEVIARFAPPTSPDNDHLIAQTTASRCEEGDVIIPIATTRMPLSFPNNVPHVILGRNDSLPVCQQTLIAKGGFSDVYKVKLHPEFLFFIGCGARGPFACKRLRHNDKEASHNEMEVLRKFAGNPRHSIIRLLMTFELDNKYYLIFPWASGNLREFWKGQTRPVEHPQTSLSGRRNDKLGLWMTQQCARIAGGLGEIHSILNKSPDEIPPTSGRESKLYGRHGDIKPENILWFRNSDNVSTFGTLKIADFGISRWHRNAETSRISCTPTYRAPEYDLPLPNRQVSRAYDVWSLGCVFLEFTTWFLSGRDGVEAFQQERRTHVKDDAFFVLDDGRFSINPSITQQFEVLQTKASSFEPPLRESLLSFLVFVSSCLEVDEDKRPSANNLAGQLNDLYVRLNKAVASKHGSLASLEEEHCVGKQGT